MDFNNCINLINIFSKKVNDEINKTSYFVRVSHRCSCLQSNMTSTLGSILGGIAKAQSIEEVQSIMVGRGMVSRAGGKGRSVLDGDIADGVYLKLTECDSSMIVLRRKHEKSPCELSSSLPVVKI